MALLHGFAGVVGRSRCLKCIEKSKGGGLLTLTPGVMMMVGWILLLGIATEVVGTLA